MMNLGLKIVVLHIHLMLPEKQQGDPLRQVCIFPNFIRVAGDSDDRHCVSVEPDRHVDALAHTRYGVFLSYGYDFSGTGSCMAALVILIDPGFIRAGTDSPIGIDIIDVMITDGFECFHDLPGQLKMNRF